MDRWLVAFAIGVSTVIVTAQAPKPTFEVASVKRRVEPLIRTGFENPNVRQGPIFKMPSATVASLVQFAYDVKDSLIVDGPDWIRKDRFDIDARAAAEVPTAQMRLMVQSLLEDRFRLATHVEPRVMSHFVLKLARSNSELGPNIQLVAACGEAATRAKRPQMPSGSVMSGGCGRMSMIVDMAVRRMGVPVLDSTGVDGMFDFVMFVSPDESRSPSSQSAPSDPGLPSFSTALREQLGLRLEAARGPVDVLVIDSVQRPTEN